MSTHFRLESAFDDVLDRVTQFIDAHQLAKLYLCGSTELNKRLRRSVRRFDLDYPPRSACTWPKLISVFSGLEWLKICAHRVSNSSGFVTNVDYTLVPRSIRHMELYFANALLSFITLPSPSLASHKFEPTLYANLPEMFPHLRLLQFSNSYVYKMNRWHFNKMLKELDGETSCILGSLSSSALVGFLAKYSCFNVYPRHLHALALRLDDYKKVVLPPNLTSLRLESPGWEHLLPQLPATLTSLRLMSPQRVAEDAWSHLTRLAHLREFLCFQGQLDATLARCLPRSIRSLTLSGFGAGSLFDCLPPALEELAAWIHNISFDPCFSKAAAQISSAKESRSTANIQNKMASKGDKTERREKIVVEGGPVLPESLARVTQTLIPMKYPVLWHTMPRSLTAIDSEHGIKDLCFPIESGQSTYACDLPRGLKDWELLALKKQEIEKIAETARIHQVSINGILNSRLAVLPDGSLPDTYELPPITKEEDEDEEYHILEALKHQREMVDLQIKALRSFDLRPLNTYQCALSRLVIDVSGGGLKPYPGMLEAVDFQAPWARYLTYLSIPPSWLSEVSSPIQFFSKMPKNLETFISSFKTYETPQPTPDWFTGETHQTPSRPYLLPSEVLAHLPPNLTSVVIRIAHLDSSHWPNLPKRLARLTLEGNEMHPDLALQDLLLLPKSVQSILLPTPTHPSWLDDSFSDWVRTNTRLSSVSMEGVMHSITPYCGITSGEEPTLSNHLSQAIAEINLERSRLTGSIATDATPDHLAVPPPVRRSKRKRN